LFPRLHRMTEPAVAVAKTVACFGLFASLLLFNTAGDAQLNSSGGSHRLVSVADFGAPSDGRTDATTPIAAALAQVCSLGGGHVYFPPGTYLVSGKTVEIPCGKVTLSGDGEVSIIRLADGQPKFTRIIHSDGVSGIEIRDLAIDGNRANQDPGFEQQHAVFLANVKNSRIENNYIHDTVGDGVLAWNGSDGIIVTNNVFERVKRCSINYQGASHSIASDNTIRDDDAFAVTMEFDAKSPASVGNVFSSNVLTNVAAGFNINGAASANFIQNVVVNGNSIDLRPNGSPNWSVGIYISGTTHGVVSGNSVEHAKFGIWVGSAASSVSLAGNVITDSSFGVFIGVGLKNAPTDVLVAGNVIDRSQIGISVRAAVDQTRPARITISNNSITNSAQRGVSIGSSDSVSVTSNSIQAGSDAAVMLYKFTTPSSAIDIANNRIWSTSPTASIGIRTLPTDVIDSLSVRGNQFSGVPQQTTSGIKAIP